MGIAVLAAAGVAGTAPPQAVRIMFITINSVKTIHSFDFG
jgi:hypothetical protein